MQKKWEFELTLFVESEDQPADHTTFHDEDSTIEIIDLSEKRNKQKDRYGTAQGVDWSNVENPMELYKVMESMGDENTLSFRTAWDGGFSASILRSFNWRILPKVELRVYPASGGKEDLKKKFQSKPIVKFTLAAAQIRFVEYEPKVGGERFAVKFGHLSSEFN